MNKELSPLEAFKNIFNYLADDTKEEYKVDLKIIKTALKDFEELKKGIAWRIAEYKKELDSGVDCDGIPLSETNRKIVLNLYNIMGALESYYKEKN